MGSGPCKCCNLSPRFSCSEVSMDFKLLISGVGISLLLFPDPDPEIHHDETTTLDPEKLDGESEKLYKSWRSRREAEEYETQCKRRKYEEEKLKGENGVVDMSSKWKQPTKGQEVSDKTEQHVQALFREQMNKQSLQQPVALFSNLHPGPRIAYEETPFGQLLEQILENNPQKKRTLLKAFNVPNPESPDPWRKQVNRTRREMDLVIVVGKYSSVIEVEVKSGTNVEKAVKQMKWFCKYMGDFHGSFVKNFSFVPIVATSTNATLCNDCQLDIHASTEDIDRFWLQDRFESLSNNSATTAEECKSLIKRLLLVSSLVLTSLPAPSEDSDLNLILLRESQWNFLSARPPVAIIHGEPSTGKSTALELGLAFILPNGNIDRHLASFVCIQNVQYLIRQKFFKDSGSDITLYAQEEEEEGKESGKNSILGKVMGNIENKKSIDHTPKHIVCIDNVPQKDLQNPDLLKQLVSLKENCQHLWIVIEDKLSEEDQWKIRMMCQEDLGPTFLEFE